MLANAFESRVYWIELNNNWQNLFKQFPQKSTTNFAIYFHQIILKEKTAVFKECDVKLVFFTQEIRSLYITLILFFHWHHELSLYKVSMFENLCMNRPSLDCVSWNSIVHFSSILLNVGSFIYLKIKDILRQCLCMNI